ncbi:MAG: sulfurtransferase TusA family protein [Acidobacteriota bacterium]|nr:sulfurtransferase TusA family protein [Acidobacteriota bacterium]
MFYKLPPQLEAEISELESRIEDVKSGRLKPAELKAHRVPFGVYEQRKSDTYMMRIRCTGGAVTPFQLRAAAQLAQANGSSILHITTRQELQLHDIALDAIIPIMRELIKVQLSTRGGGGNTVRNIVASPSAGVDPEEPFDVSPYLFALTSRLMEEPDSWLLPRKFKIAFSNTFEDTVQAAFHDVGFIATLREGRAGFSVYLAGGLGAKPAIGHRVHEFLPAEETYIVVEAVKRLYGRHGNRRNRHRNRLRFLWQDMGEQAFLDQYRLYCQEVRNENPEPLSWQPTTPIPCALPSPAAASGQAFEQWKRRYVFPDRQRGVCRILVPVAHGNLPAHQAILLADFLEPFGPDTLRGTREQNLLLRHIPETHLGNVYALIRDWNPLVHAAPFLARAVVCTGASTCKLGICLPRPALDAIVREIDRAHLALDDLDDFRMNLSGCPNSCGNHWIADLGFYGKAAHKGGRVYPAYAVVSGGGSGHGGATLARNVGEIPARNLPAFVREFIELYLTKRSRFGTTRDYVQTEGSEDLKSLSQKYASVPEYESNPEYYSDWSEARSFSMSDRSKGECSAGLFDLIEFDLKRARQCWAALDGALVTAERTELLYQAVLSTARALLITRGAEPHGEVQIFELFLKHFVETGLVDDGFRTLVAAGASKDYAALQANQDEARNLLAAVEDLYKSMDDSLHFSAEREKTILQKQTPAEETGILIKDLRGVACPMNFVKAKIVLESMQAGQHLAVLLDDGAPIENVPRSIQGEGHGILEQTRKGDHWYVLIEKRS